MKSYSKSELASLAGVSYSTFYRYLLSRREELTQMGITEFFEPEGSWNAVVNKSFRKKRSFCDFCVFCVTSPFRKKRTFCDFCVFCVTTKKYLFLCAEVVKSRQRRSRISYLCIVKSEAEKTGTRTRNYSYVH